MAIDRPALRYYGGKWAIAPWIIAHLPEHDLYCEPYGGAGSVLLQKPASPLEVLNDLDGDICNFFRVLRERPAELIHALELTPFSREEYELTYEVVEDADPLERARRVAVRAWQGRSGAVNQWRSGWRYNRKLTNGAPAVRGWAHQDHLCAIAERLRMVQLENDDALACIKRFDGPRALFYVDPPYVQIVRSRWRRTAYRHEMSEDDHIRLAEVLRAVQGMAIVSGYETALYAELYSGWHTESHMARTEAGTTRREILWISPAAAARGRQGKLC